MLLLRHMKSLQLAIVALTDRDERVRPSHPDSIANFGIMTPGHG